MCMVGIFSEKKKQQQKKNKKKTTKNKKQKNNKKTNSKTFLVGIISDTLMRAFSGMNYLRISLIKYKSVKKKYT